MSMDPSLLDVGDLIYIMESARDPKVILERHSTGNVLAPNTITRTNRRGFGYQKTPKLQRKLGQPLRGPEKLRSALECSGFEDLFV
jgi:hypothetical protein